MVFQALNSQKKVILFFAWEEKDILWAESVVRRFLSEAYWIEVARLKKDVTSFIQMSAPSLFGPGRSLVLKGVKESDRELIQKIIPLLGTFPLILFSQYLPKTSKLRSSFQGIPLSPPSPIEIEQTCRFLSFPFQKEYLDYPPEILLDEIQYGNGFIYKPAPSELDITALRLEQRTLEKSLPSGSEIFQKMKLLREKEKHFKGN